MRHWLDTEQTGSGYRSTIGPSFLKTYSSIAYNMTLIHDKCAASWTTLGKNLINLNLKLIKPKPHIWPQTFGNFWKKQIKTSTMKSQPLIPKQMVPDYGKSQHKNPSHSKTRLPDDHDSAANVTNPAFYSVSLQRACSHFQTKTPVILWPNP